MVLNGTHWLAQIVLYGTHWLTQMVLNDTHWLAQTTLNGTHWVALHSTKWYLLNSVNDTQKAAIG